MTANAPDPVPPLNPRFAVPTPLRLSFKTMSTVAPGPTSKLAWHIFAKPARRIRPDRYSVWDEGEPFTVQAAGHELPAWSWGEGPTVLLLHGWSSTATGMSGFVRPLVAAGFRVAAYDAFAHGSSPGVTTSGPEMARHLNEIADRLEARHVVAHSMGTVVLGFAVRGGLDVQRSVLLNAPADMPYFLSQFTRGLGFTEGVKRRMIRRFEEEHSVRWEDCIVEWVANGHEHPTLIVHDDDDVDVPWSHALRVREAWPNHRAITTRGLGHRGSLHSPEVVTAVADFLRGGEVTLPAEVTASDRPHPGQVRRPIGPTV